VNFFQPVQKLIGKEREGSKLRKVHDLARTPYRRALESGVLSEASRAELDALRAAHGPLALRRRLDSELERLWPLRIGGRSQVETA